MPYRLINIFLLLFICQPSTAQEEDYLKVGDPAPPINVHGWIKGEPIARIEKGKIYVVEFGATWCKPCVHVIPKLTAIAKKHQDVTVVGIFVMELNNEPPETKNPAYVNRVKNYVAKQAEKMEYNVAVDDQQDYMELNWLKKATNGLPFTFLIDKDGRIAWMGGDANMLESMIEKIKQKDYNIDQAISRALKNDIEQTKYDPSKLLLINGNGGEEDDFQYRSLMTIYKGDIKMPPPMFVGSVKWAKEGSQMYPFRARVQATGATLLELYQLAYSDTLYNQVSTRTRAGIYTDSLTNPYEKSSYGKHWFEPVLEVRDKKPFETTHPSPKNKYNYSLKVPLEKNTARFLQQAMQRDLKTYFGYEVSLETRMMRCWKLKAHKNAMTILKTNTPGLRYRTEVSITGQDVTYKNAETADIISVLGSFFGYGFLDYKRLPPEDLGPFMDETGITKQFDFIIAKAERDDFQLFQKLLGRLGLYLEKSQQRMKVVVIRDPVLN